MATAVAHQTEAQRVRAAVLKALDAAVNKMVTDEDILYQGDRMILPTQYQGDLPGAIRALKERADAEEQEFEFERTYYYRPYDVAGAFQRAIIRATGMSPKGVTQRTFFGKIPPSFVSAKSGPDGQTEQVPWGEYHVEMLDAEFNIGAQKSEHGGYNGQIYVTSKQKHRKRIDFILSLIETELREHSLYRGMALSGDSGIEMDFFDPNSLDPAKIIYNKFTLDQLEANVWTPIRYPDVLRGMRVPLRRAVLLAGPNGTGKTSAGTLTAQIATQNGWTFIKVAKTEDPKLALVTARQYSPAVVWYEDIDDLTAGATRQKVSILLDELDNVSNKNTEVIAVFTTNFPEAIEKGVLRPGRIDAVIPVGGLDDEAKRRLIEALIPDGMLDANIDWDQVTAACKGAPGPNGEPAEDFLPAFLTETTQRALRYAVANAHGDRPKNISTLDLVQAAEGLQPQLKMWQDAGNTSHHRPEVETAIRDLVVRAAGDAVRSHKGVNPRVGDIEYVSRNGNSN